MRTLLLIAALVLSNVVAAAGDSHEAAANRFVAAWLDFDMPRMLHTAYGASPQAHKIPLMIEALESPELRAIWAKHLMTTFSEEELIALEDLVRSPAYRVYLERMPMFAARAFPEMMNFLQRNEAELTRRVLEKQKKRLGK
jgi:hypothetical protein